MLKDLLEQKYRQYNTRDFIVNDPISIPHRFSRKENIEISGFLTATLAWGKRTTIINNAEKLMELMDNDPHNFLINFEESDLRLFEKFIHRTFNFTDLKYFILALSNIYRNHGGLHNVFGDGFFKRGSMKDALIEFYQLFFELPHEHRTEKHVANVVKGAAAKRLNMYLRWMIRSDDHQVDFGIWNDIPASALYIPLDVHTGNVARELGLLKRKQDDWKAVDELTQALRIFDPDDPVKYDYALFGMGVNE